MAHSPARRGHSLGGAWDGLEPLEPRQLLSADLALALKAFKGNLTPGQTVFVPRITQQNKGDAEAAGYGIRFVLSTNKVFGDSDDIAFDEVFSPDDTFVLPAKKSVPVSNLPLVIPITTPPGVYYFGAKIDADDAVEESNENNNVIFTSKAEVVVGSVVSIKATKPNAGESGKPPGAVTITRLGPTNEPLTVQISRDGSATLGDDFQLLDSKKQPVGDTITIPAKARSVTLSVVGVQDTTVEGNETVVLSIASNPTYGIVSGLGSATVNIVDDEPNVSVKAADKKSAEKATGEKADGGSFILTLSKKSAGDTLVAFNMTGSASDDDYTLSVGGAPVGDTIVIPAGKTSVKVDVTVIDDAVAEPSETVIFNVLSGVTYTAHPLPSKASATVTLADNEPIASIVAADRISAETPDGAAVDAATFTVSLAKPATTDITVTFGIAGDASLGDDYTLTDGLGNPISETITIPAGAKSATIIVTPVDDTTAENAEAVILTLESTDAYTANPAKSSATAAIIDNEPVVSIAIIDATVDEGGDTGAFKITLDRPAPTDMVISLAADPNSDANDADYALAVNGDPVAGSVVIPQGQSSITVDVSAPDDGLDEGPEQLLLNVIPDETYSVKLGSSSVTLTIADPNRDLVVSGIAYSGKTLVIDQDTGANPTLPVSVTIKNRGTTTANPFSVSIRLVSNAELDGVDPLDIPTLGLEIGTLSEDDFGSAELGAGKEITRTFNQEIFSIPEPGSYRVLVVVTTAGEADDTNNYKLSGSADIRIPETL